MQNWIRCLAWAAAALLAIPGPLVATDVTHMGVPPADHVVLVRGVPEDGLCPGAGFAPIDVAFRVLSTGEEVPFSVPAGRTLVVTDVDWSVFPTGSPLPEGFPVALRFYAVDESGPVGPVGRNSVFESWAEVGPLGAEVARTVALKSGLVVAAGNRVCVSLMPPSVSFGNVVLRGYLVDSKK